MKKPVSEFLEDIAPWKPAKWTEEGVGALQSIYNGKAEPYQQKLALDFIINVLAGTYEPHFHAGADGQRNTDFALGKAYVGQQIVKLLKINLSVIRTGKRGEN